MSQPFQLLETVQASLSTKTINYWLFGHFTFYVKKEKFRRKGIITATDSEVFFYSEEGEHCHKNELSFDEVNLVYNEEECLNEILVTLKEEDSYATMSLISQVQESDFFTFIKQQPA